MAVMAGKAWRPVLGVSADVKPAAEEVGGRAGRKAEPPKLNPVEPCRVCAAFLAMGVTEASLQYVATLYAAQQNKAETGRASAHAALLRR